MHSKRLLDLLVIGLSALSVAEATFIHGRADARDVRAIQKRQDDPPTNDPPAAATTSEPTPPESTPPTPTPSSKPPPDTTSTPPPPETTSTRPTPTPTSSTPQPPETSKKPTTSNTSVNPPPETTSSPTQDPTEPVVKTITSFSTVTNSDGSKSTVSSEVLTTAPPGLAENGGGGGGSGMTPETRNTVIGVVVGVGGAIVLVGLGFVAWRIWGRKRNQEERDGLMDFTTPNDGKSEVGGSMSGRTPFQSTLESYHAPTQVNQAANF